MYNCTGVLQKEHLWRPIHSPKIHKVEEWGSKLPRQSSGGSPGTHRQGCCKLAKIYNWNSTLIIWEWIVCFIFLWDEMGMFFGHQWRILKHSGKIQYTLGHKWQNRYNVTNFGLVFSNPTPRGTPTKAAPQRHWRRVLRRRGGIGVEVLEIPGSWWPRLQTHLQTSRAHWSCVKANIQGVSE